MKVVRITGRLAIGGPSRQVCFLHEQLRRSCETILIAGRLDAGEGDMQYLLASQEGVHVLDSMGRPVRPWSDAVSFFRILKILRKERPDIVHTHSAKAGALGRAAAWLSRVPVRVHTYHGHVFEGYFSPIKTRVFRTVERLLGKFTTRIVAVSDSQADELADCYQIADRKKIAVVKNGIDLTDFGDNSNRVRTRRELGIRDHQTLILWAGRLAPVKGIELLAEVIRKANTSDMFYFLVAGDGTERRPLERLVSEGFPLKLLGWRADMPKLWAAADVALLTSVNEGTPTSLIEAMATAKPFVATDVGGVRDLAVTPLHSMPLGGSRAQNGFLTPRNSAFILDCLQLLSRERELAAKMGLEGRKFVEQEYNQQRLLRDIESLYYELLTATRGGFPKRYLVNVQGSIKEEKGKIMML